MKIEALIIIIFIIALTIFLSFSIVSAIELNSSFDEYGESTQIICSDNSNFNNSNFILSKQNSSYSHIPINHTYFNTTNFTLDEYGEIVPSDTVEKVKDSEIPYCNRTLPLDKFLNFVGDKGSCFKNYTISSLKNHGIIPDYCIDKYNKTELQKLGYSDEFIQQYLNRNMIDKTNFNDIVFWHIIAELDSDHHDKIAKQLFGEEPNKNITDEITIAIINKTMKEAAIHGAGILTAKLMKDVSNTVRQNMLIKINEKLSETEMKIKTAELQKGYVTIKQKEYAEHDQIYSTLHEYKEFIDKQYKKNFPDMGDNTYQKYQDLRKQNTIDFKDLSFWLDCQKAHTQYTKFLDKYYHEDSFNSELANDESFMSFKNYFPVKQELSAWIDEFLGEEQQGTVFKLKLSLLQEFFDKEIKEQVRWMDEFDTNKMNIEKKLKKLTKHLKKLKARQETLKSWDSDNVFAFTYTMYLGVKVGFGTILLSKNIDKHFIEHEHITDWEMDGYFEYYKNRLIASLEY